MYIQALQLESREFHYGEGLQQSVLRKLWRGFNDAMNGSLDDGWYVITNDDIKVQDAIVRIALAINHSPNKVFARGAGVICAKATMELKNVTPALVLRFLREHRLEWDGFGADAHFHVGCQKASGHEEVVHTDGQALSINNMYLLQLCSGVDENSPRGGGHLLFAPIPKSFASEDDAFLLPSGFRIRPTAE